MTKELGKITKAEFGQINDYPFLFGLQLEFSLSGGSFIGDGGKYTVNISPECRWETCEREEAIVKMIENTNKILTDAKVHCISELINKPVEVSLEHDMFKDFRILTEVL